MDILQFTNREAEERLLATILADSNPFDKLYEVIDIVKPSMWVHFQSQIRSLIRAAAEGDELPQIEVNAEPCKNKKEFTALANELKTLYLKREGDKFLLAGREALKDPEVDVNRVLSELEQRLSDLQNAHKESKSGQVLQALSLVDELLEETERRYQLRLEGGTVGLPTMIDKLDEELGGLQEGMHLLAAEPGAGKSTFALQIARTVSEQGYPALFVSYEENVKRLVLKCFCALANRRMKDFTDGEAGQEELLQIIKEHQDKLKNLFFIQGDKDLTVLQIKAKARRIMQRTGKDKCLIVIDYLQKMASYMKKNDPNSDFRLVVSGLSGSIRTQLALDLGCPVLAISSQNRSGQGTSSLTSLKEAAELEYDADSVMFLTHEEETDIAEMGARHVILHLQKNRYGDKAKINLTFHADTGYFEEGLITTRKPTHEPSDGDNNTNLNNVDFDLNKLNKLKEKDKRKRKKG